MLQSSLFLLENKCSKFSIPMRAGIVKPLFFYVFSIQGSLSKDTDFG